MERYRLIVESLSDGVFTFDLKGNVTSVNNVVLRYGYKKEELIGKSLLEFIPEKHWPMISEHLADLAEGKSTRGEVELNTKKGTVIAEFRSSLVKKRGKIIGFQTIVRDIMEMKKAEKALKESEQKLRDVIENSPDAIVWVDTTGKITLVNRKGFEITGFSEDDLIGKNFMDVEALTQESKEKILEGFMKRIEGIDTPPYEVEVVAKNGEIIPAELSASLIYEGGKIVGTQSIFRDLRERKKAEEELRFLKEFNEGIVHSIGDGLLVIDPNDYTIITANKAVLKQLKLRIEDLIGKTCYEVTHHRSKPCKPPHNICPIQGMLKTGKVVTVEHKHFDKDNKQVFVEVSASPVRNKEGKIVHFVHLARDVTERKKMEKKLVEYSQKLEGMVEKRTRELKESEEKLKDLFKTIPDSIAIVDLNGNLLEFNETTLELFGYPREEIIGKNVFDFIAKEDLEKSVQVFKQALEKRIVRMQLSVLAKDGRKIPVELNASVLKGPKGNLVGSVAVLRDITERKRMEEQLLKSERMAAIGELATMVGHDLRNPLSTIQNACYYVKTKFGASKDEKLKKMFEVVGKEINHANNIVKDLLDFSRVKKPELKKVNLISSIQDALSQLEFPENVTLITKFSEVPTIEADPDQLRRVFQNIALNGIQAMPNDGKLTVSTRKNGGFVEVAFTDTGIGIPEENMDKLFTPLFTTKAQGVGLGLPICKNLVEGHNGRIEVKSKVGKGSTFTVKLPIHQSKGGEK